MIQDFLIVLFIVTFLHLLWFRFQYPSKISDRERELLESKMEKLEKELGELSRDLGYEHYTIEESGFRKIKKK